MADKKTIRQNAEACIKALGWDNDRFQDWCVDGCALQYPEADAFSDRQIKDHEYLSGMMVGIKLLTDIPFEELAAYVMEWE